MDGILGLSLLDEDKHGLRLLISGVLPAAITFFSEDDLREAAYLTIDGKFSARAFDDLSIEIRDVMTTLLRNIFWLKEYGTECEHKAELLALAARLSKKQQADEETESPDRKYTFQRKQISAHLTELLEAYFAPAKKDVHEKPKDSITARIRNAIQLLIQADQQLHTGVGLALSVCSMEALLCNKDENLGKTLGESVAVLLEPDPRHRADAEEFTKKLYGKRSDVLHNGQAQIPEEDLEGARMLAAAVMKAFVERRHFRRMGGWEDDKPKDLISEMNKDKYTAGQLTGVADSPAVFLWRGGRSSALGYLGS